MRGSEFGAAADTPSTVTLATPQFNRTPRRGRLGGRLRVSLREAEVCPERPPAPGRFTPERATGDQLSLGGCSKRVAKVVEGVNHAMKIKKLTTLLVVDSIEDCLATWQR